MSLTTLTFLAVYFPALFAIYYSPFCKSIASKNIVLLLASLAFYACAEPIYIALLVLSILFNYGMTKLERRTGNKAWGNAAIVADVALLLSWKYFSPTLSTLTIGNDEFIKFALPIGISYYTLREISYIVECRRDEECAKLGLVEAALFLSNFMTITVGPLGMWNEESREIVARTFNKDNVYAGICRVAQGLIKKVIIADSLNEFVNFCFASGPISVFLAWAGAIGFTLQLYFDFSGYTDMAIGLGKVFGFSFLENFNMPYTAKSIIDFWRRWHMSLTRWLKIYIYIPLGGSRVDSKARHILNIFLVWFCSGIWHGFDCTFIVGLVFFVFVFLEKFTSINKWLDAVHLGNIYTMLIVMFCWVLFRAASFTLAGNYIGYMFGNGGTGWIGKDDLAFIVHYTIPFLAAIFLSSSISVRIGDYLARYRAMKVVGYCLLFALFVFTMIVMLGRGYTAPLYGF